MAVLIAYFGTLFLPHFHFHLYTLLVIIFYELILIILILPISYINSIRIYQFTDFVQCDLRRLYRGYRSTTHMSCHL